MGRLRGTVAQSAWYSLERWVQQVLIVRSLRGLCAQEYYEHWADRGQVECSQKSMARKAWSEKCGQSGAFGLTMAKQADLVSFSHLTCMRLTSKDDCSEASRTLECSRIICMHSNG